MEMRHLRLAGLTLLIVFATCRFGYSEIPVGGPNAKIADGHFVNGTLIGGESEAMEFLCETFQANIIEAKIILLDSAGNIRRTILFNFTGNGQKKSALPVVDPPPPNNDWTPIPSTWTIKLEVTYANHGGQIQTASAQTPMTMEDLAPGMGSDIQVDFVSSAVGGN